MASIFGNIGKNVTGINDEIIVETMIASSIGAANAYLNATLVSATPELSAMYSTGLNQVLGGHSAVKELALKRGWQKPYDSPVQQLTEEYSKSKSTIQLEDK